LVGKNLDGVPGRIVVDEYLRGVTLANRYKSTN